MFQRQPEHRTEVQRLHDVERRNQDLENLFAKEKGFKSFDAYKTAEQRRIALARKEAERQQGQRSFAKPIVIIVIIIAIVWFFISRSGGGCSLTPY